MMVINWPVIVFWSLLLVASMWQWLDAVLGLKPEFTRGEAAGIAVTAVVALGAAIWTVLKAYTLRHPIKMRFSDEPYDADPKSIDIGRTYRPNIKARTGIKTLTIRLDTRTPTDIDEINIRFVKKPFLGKPTMADSSVIKILEASVPYWDERAEFERDYVGPNEVQRKPDGHGGEILSLRKPKRWPVGDPQWIVLKVEALQPWSGHLSVVCRMARRTTVRRKVKFRKAR